MEGTRKKIITVSLDKDTIEQIDALAAARHQSRSSTIQSILDAYLDGEGERAAQRHEQMQEAYQKEYTEEEAREIFFKVVREYRDFHEIFHEMRRYEHINEKELFIRVINGGWVQYLEKFNEVRLTGHWSGVADNRQFHHIQMRPFIIYRVEEFPFQY